jgi:cell division protein FtsB
MGLGIHIAEERPAQAPGRGQRVFYNIVFMLSALVVAYGFLYTYQVWRQETAFKLQEVEQMRRQVAQVQAQNDHLKSHIGFMQTPQGVEKVAREQLGLVRPNETTYIVINGKKHPSAETTPEPTAEAPAMSLPHRCIHWFHELWNGGD